MPEKIACTGCRALKAKCSAIDAPHTIPCDRCVKASKACVVAPPTEEQRRRDQEIKRRRSKPLSQDLEESSTASRNKEYISRPPTEERKKRKLESRRESRSWADDLDDEYLLYSEYTPDHDQEFMQGFHSDRLSSDGDIPHDIQAGGAGRRKLPWVGMSARRIEELNDDDSSRRPEGVKASSRNSKEQPPSGMNSGQAKPGPRPAAVARVRPTQQVPKLSSSVIRVAPILNTSDQGPVWPSSIARLPAGPLTSDQMPNISESQHRPVLPMVEQVLAPRKSLEVRNNEAENVTASVKGNSIEASHAERSSAVVNNACSVGEQVHSVSGSQHRPVLPPVEQKKVSNTKAERVAASVTGDFVGISHAELPLTTTEDNLSTVMSKDAAWAIWFTEQPNTLRPAQLRRAIEALTGQAPPLNLIRGALLECNIGSIQAFYEYLGLRKWMKKNPVVVDEDDF